MAGAVDGAGADIDGVEVTFFAASTGVGWAAGFSAALVESVACAGTTAGFLGASATVAVLGATLGLGADAGATRLGASGTTFSTDDEAAGVGVEGACAAGLGAARRGASVAGFSATDAECAGTGVDRGRSSSTGTFTGALSKGLT